MLDEICGSIHNYFESDVLSGEFEIVGGSIALDLKDGQYFRVVGSAFNDGVWCYPAVEMIDETFDGEIWAMNVPRDFLKIANEIKDWQTTNGNVGAYQSESFGGYSYQRATNGNGKAVGWQDAFSDRLKRWRKLP